MLRNNFLTSHKFSNDSSPRESCMQSHIYTLLLYIIYIGRKHPYNARMNLLTESLLCILNSSDMFSFICLYKKRQDNLDTTNTFFGETRLLSILIFIFAN